MSSDDRKRAYRRDLLLASAMVAGGLAIFGLSVAQLVARNPQMAQATQPLQSSPTPTPAPQENPPAESKARRRASDHAGARAGAAGYRGAEDRCAAAVAAGPG